jgi:hypothetical protein
MGMAENELSKGEWDYYTKATFDFPHPELVN